MTRVVPDEVGVGSIIVVNPGEKIPLDGVVVEGASALNTGALTGESMPVPVGAESDVLSGSINMTGVLRIRTTAGFEESTASKILELVENAAARKSRSEHFIARFARCYTPIVVCAALLLAVLPPLVILLLHRGAAPVSAGALWGEWALRACSFLVISCPCALVVSIPLGFFAGLGGAGSQGILIKGSNYLEALSRGRLVAFDKTGTVTKGNFSVTTVHRSPIPKETPLEYAALAESHSTHPISRSLREAYGKHIDPARVPNVQELGGHGITAEVDGVPGRRRQREADDAARRRVRAMPARRDRAAHGGERGIQRPHRHLRRDQGAREGRHGGPPARGRRAHRHADGRRGKRGRGRRGGDRPAGVPRGAPPADKVRCVEALLRDCGGRARLAFVATIVINDAPVLARADVGIAMGALGSDAAIEAADVVLMDDDPLKIAKAIRISKKCLRIVRQNVVFALGVKVLCLLLAAVGLVGMWVAIAADVGVMILAVLNAIRCLFVRNL